MPFPLTPILDDFNRPDQNPIAGNWTNDALGEGANNQLKIVSNTCQAVTLDTSCEAYWNPQQFNENIEVYFTVVTKPGLNQRFECGFVQKAGQVDSVSYQALFSDDIAGTDTISINSPLSQIATTAREYNVGDVLGFRRYANDLFEVYQNGIVVLSAFNTELKGQFYLYLGIRSIVGAVDNFGGGNFITDIDRHITRGLFRGIGRGIG